MWDGSWFSRIGSLQEELHSIGLELFYSWMHINQGIFYRTVYTTHNIMLIHWTQYVGYLIMANKNILYSF